MTFWIVTVQLVYPDGSRERYTVVVEAPTQSLARRRAAARIRRQGWLTTAIASERITAASLRNGVLLYAREREAIRTEWLEKPLRGER